MKLTLSNSHPSSDKWLMVSTPICVSPQTLSHSSISPLLPSPIYPHFLTLIVSIFSCPCCPWEGKMTPSVRLIIARHHRTRASLLYLQTKMKTNRPRCWCTLGLWGKKKRVGSEMSKDCLYFQYLCAVTVRALPPSWLLGLHHAARTSSWHHASATSAHL